MKYRWLRSSKVLIAVPLLLLLAGIAVACGDDATPTAPATSTSPAPTATSPAPTATSPGPTATSPAPTVTSPAPTATAVPGFLLRPPEPNPKYGGIFKLTITSNPAHFDVQQSGSSSISWTQNPMHNTLLRYDPLEAGFSTRRPDLATEWTVSDGGMTVTFKLRKGVKFHDGAAFTAEDVKATYDRIIFPPTGILSFSQTMFDTVTEVKVIDLLTVQFKLSAPRALFLEAVSIDQHIILRKKTIDDNNSDLKRAWPSPGTGPFIGTGRVTGESWEFTKNEEYWDPALPLVDGIKMTNANWGPDTSANFLAGQADYSMGLDNSAYEKAKTDDKFIVNQFPSTSQQGLWFNHNREPFDDVRVRKAFHLVVDYFAVRAASNPIQPFKERGWLPNGDPFFPEYWAIAKDQPGWRKPTAEDIAEAKKLMADAGLADGIKNVDFQGRDEPFERALVPVVQGLLKQHLKVESVVNLEKPTVNRELLNKGDFDITENGPGFATPFLFQQWGNLYLPGALRNWGDYENPEFTTKFEKLLVTTDKDAQRKLVFELVAILDADVPNLIWASPGINQGWKKDVKGHRKEFSRAPADSMRWETVWLDR